MGRELQPEPGSRGLTEEDIVHIPVMASCWVRLADGSKAHYMMSGDTGPAIILLHGGLPGSSGTAGWRFMAPMLGANGFRVFSPDRPGFGWADTTATQVYTVHDLHPFLADEIVRRGAARAGLSWHYNRPPVRDLEYEMDCRGVAQERGI